MVLNWAAKSCKRMRTTFSEIKELCSSMGFVVV